MTRDEFAARLKSACAAVAAAEGELTEIDSRFGDADHGLTMAKIAGAVSAAAEASEGGVQAAPEGGEIDIPGLQAVFAQGLEELGGMSGARVGDKTMMDALIPASEAVAAYAGSNENELFAAAARAAMEGALATKEFVSRFGRAKSYGEKTIGTPDAGAMSMAYFFQGLAQI